METIATTVSVQPGTFSRVRVHVVPTTRLCVHHTIRRGCLQQRMTRTIKECTLRCHATPREDNRDAEDTGRLEFGYTRKDIILIGTGLLGMGFFLNWLLESVFHVDPIMAGNYAQLIIFVGLCVGWIGSYLFRVATKQMTYAKQLEDYEEAVMQKRLEELPEAELENIMESIEEEEKRRRG